MFPIFVSCPKGIEELLANEVSNIGAQSLRQTIAGLSCHAELKQVYQICLWSRFANRVIVNLANFPVDSIDDLYKGVKAVEWESHLKSEHTIIVDFSGTSGLVKNTQFGAQKVKDALVDRMRDVTGDRPSVAKKSADIRINARLHKGQLSVGIDLSGDSLHRRGYRLEQGVAPLKENLAAALLTRAGWPELAKQGKPLLDPLCGSGTLLIEAAWMAADVAPGLMRKHFGFFAWNKHDSALWEQILADAHERKRLGMSNEYGEIRGYDYDYSVLDKAQSNIERAGLESWVRVLHKDVENFKKPTHTKLEDGLIICNPPYGERLGEIETLTGLYQTLGQVTKRECAGWRLAVFTGNPQLSREMRLRTDKIYKLFNGTIPSELLIYSLLSKEQSQLREGPSQTKPNITKKSLTESAQMLVNRFKKNTHRLKAWRNQLKSNCYRIYDADLPEYAAAIDVYDGRLHIQEYAPPKTVDENAAAKRFQDIVLAAAHFFGVEREHIAVKSRRINKGKQQYEKLRQQDEEQFFLVREGKAKYRVNLDSYLDTGVFLDHRLLRFRIHEEALGKRFLNLFCYTATATVQAALGGAKATTSVDMSNTYIQWAKENFEINQLSLEKNQLIQQECLAWLKNCRQGFDVIMLDPPSFSNSKRMEGVLDIQRDHGQLIKRCMDLLSPAGTLYFSNNLRSFKLDGDLTEQYDISDITGQTIDRDFDRNKKIHTCFLIKHAD